MKKLESIEIANTKLMVSYILAKPDGVIKINGLRIFPATSNTELSEVLSDNAKLLINKAVANKLSEDFDDIFY